MAATAKCPRICLTRSGETRRHRDEGQEGEACLIPRASWVAGTTQATQRRQGQAGGGDGRDQGLALSRMVTAHSAEEAQDWLL
jgi:hypothetical protein